MQTLSKKEVTGEICIAQPFQLNRGAVNNVSGQYPSDTSFHGTRHPPSKGKRESSLLLLPTFTEIIPRPQKRVKSPGTCTIFAESRTYAPFFFWRGIGHLQQRRSYPTFGRGGGGTAPNPF